MIIEMFANVNLSDALEFFVTWRTPGTVVGHRGPPGSKPTDP